MSADPNIIRKGLFNYFIINADSSHNVETLMGYDALLLEYTNVDYARYIIKTVRSHHDPELYLKPIFIFNISRTPDAMMAGLIDGSLISLNHIDIIEESVKRLYLKINELYLPKGISFEAKVINKMVNLLYTRDRNTLKPFQYFQSSLGYIYPEISINFDHHDESRVLEILDIAEKEDLLTASFEQRIYLCPNCSGGYLNYREVCPKCNSSDSSANELVHHFRCAYVGPIQDYQNAIDDHLNCPKCNKTLRHIGVDYDKPSVLFNCNHCSHTYQDYNVKALCHLCSHDHDVENLVARSIKSYQLTKKGESVALNGYLSVQKDMDEIIGTVKYDIFKVMLNYEIQRLKQTDYESNIGYIHMVNGGEIYSRLGGDRQKAMIGDLVMLLRNNLRSSDYISFYDSNTLVLSMNDIPHKVAQNILNEIVGLIHRLMARKVKGVDLNLEYDSMKLRSDLGHEMQLNKLLHKITS